MLSNRLKGQGWFSKEFKYIRVALVRVKLKDLSNIRRVLKKDYYNKLEKITKYLTTLKRSKGILRGAFQSFLKGALKYAIIKNQL